MDVASVISAVATLLGATLVVAGILDMRRMAAGLERDAPDGSAASAGRSESFSMSVGPGYPPGAVAPSREELAEYRRMQPVRAEALGTAAAVLERSDARERALRSALATDLRGGIWREALGAALVVVGVAASTVSALA